MIYLFRRRVSEGARALADELNDSGVPARYTQGGALVRFRPDRDKLICWGDVHEVIQGLNNRPYTNKYNEARTLQAANVATVDVALQRPSAPPVTRGRYERPAISCTEYELHAVMNHMQAWLDAPLPVQAAPVWLPRRQNHVGGSDLLNPPVTAEYWSKKEPIANEYRLHMFKGKSIRAGQKVQRPTRPDGRPSHEWIRSFDAGWIIRYDGFQSTRAMRELAAKAVEALQLDFGAVDLAQRPDGSLFVLEVNRAPGVENGTVTSYANAIKAWAAGATS